MSEPSPFRLAVAEDVLLSRSFSRDDLLVNIMLHWVTGAIGSSFWPYYSRRTPAGRCPPSGQSRSQQRISRFRRTSCTRRVRSASARSNIQRWTKAGRGGHFAALEIPELLAEDVRAFARTLR